MDEKSICINKKCTGCCTCYNICPKNCISMVEDNLGVIKPLINYEKCINCNLCIKTCPANNNLDGKVPFCAYAVWNLDEEDRKTSASGGAATVLARHIISNNGVAFGIKFNENLEAVNCSARTSLELENFKGSKYVQSFIGTSFRDAKKTLESGNQVIFLGSPCQVDGLKTYLGKDYDNLITVDIICHGMPPGKYLKEHIDYISKKIYKKITNITFRGQEDFSFTLYSGSEIVYQNSSELDLYFRGFLKGLYYRNSCYDCKYACCKRTSDITIGDFWGLGKEVTFDRKDVQRVSLLLINTNRGERLFHECKDKFFYEKRTLEEAIKGNEQLNRSSREHIKTSYFRKNYESLGFEKTVKACLKNEIRAVKLKNNIHKVRYKVKIAINSVIKAQSKK